MLSKEETDFKEVNYKGKSYRVYYLGELKYYSFKSIRCGKEKTNIGLLDQLSDGLEKIPVNNYRPYILKKYNLTDLEYYIVVVLGGDESLLPTCTYVNPYTKEKCTKPRKFVSLVPTKVRPNIFYDGCDEHTINASAQIKQRKAYEKGITGLQKADRRSPIWRQKLRLHALKQMEEGNSIFSSDDIRKPHIVKHNQSACDLNSVRSELGYPTTNTIEELIEIDKQMYIRRGNPDDTCILYLAKLSKEFIKVGVTTDLMKRSMRGYHGYLYLKTEILYKGSRIQVAELESKIKLEFKDKICLGNEGFSVDLLDKIRLFIKNELKIIKD